MKNLKNKLCNQKGVSLIIAMVFMLICLFVGGSVLVAATMNTSRMRHVPKQQQFLDQRSAAMLIADELKVDADTSLQIIVREREITTQNVTFNDKEKMLYTGTAGKTYKVIFEAVIPEGVTLNTMQETALETAVRFYLKEHGITPDPHSGIIELVNFPKPLGEFIVPEEKGTFDIKITSDAVALDPFKVNYYIEDEDPSDFNKEYDFTVDFEKFDPAVTNQKFSQLVVRLQSAVSITKIPAIEEIIMNPRDDHKGESHITKTTQTVISWANPTIEKGA